MDLKIVLCTKVHIVWKLTELQIGIRTDHDLFLLTSVFSIFSCDFSFVICDHNFGGCARKMLFFPQSLEVRTCPPWITITDCYSLIAIELLQFYTIVLIMFGFAELVGFILLISLHFIVARLNIHVVVLKRVIWLPKLWRLQYLE